MGEDDLKDVAGGDVFFGAGDGVEEGRLPFARSEAEFAGGFPGLGAWGAVGRGAFRDGRDGGARRRRRPGACGGGVGGDDEQDFLLDVVEGEDLVEEHEAGVGHAEVVGGRLGQALDLADDIVGKEANGSGGEGRKAGNAGGRVAVEGVAEEGEDVAGDAAGAAVLGDFDGCPVRDDAAAGADADVGVAAEVFAAFDGFEEETLGLGCGEAEEGGDGGFEVGGEGAVERDEGVCGGEPLEVFA